MPVDPRIQALLDAPMTARRAKVVDRIRKGGPRGYAAMPGTGPVGQTCRQCVHKISVWGGTKRFQKCALYPNRTNGVASDIRVNSLACSLFEPKA